jgi:hypothetical protein
MEEKFPDYRTGGMLSSAQTSVIGCGPLGNGLLAPFLRSILRLHSELFANFFKG